MRTIDGIIDWPHGRITTDVPFTPHLVSYDTATCFKPCTLVPCAVFCTLDRSLYRTAQRTLHSTAYRTLHNRTLYITFVLCVVPSTLQCIVYRTFADGFVHNLVPYHRTVVSFKIPCTSSCTVSGTLYCASCTVHFIVPLCDSLYHSLNLLWHRREGGASLC